MVEWSDVLVWDDGVRKDFHASDKIGKSMIECIGAAIIEAQDAYLCRCRGIHVKAMLLSTEVHINGHWVDTDATLRFFPGDKSLPPLTIAVPIMQTYETLRYGYRVPAAGTNCGKVEYLSVLMFSHSFQHLWSLLQDRKILLLFVERCGHPYPTRSVKSFLLQLPSKEGKRSLIKKQAILQPGKPLLPKVEND